jgi:hypothetical protein
MRLIQKLLLLVLFFLSMFLSCEDIDPLRDVKKDRIEYGEVRRDTLFAVADTFLTAGRVNTGFSPKIHLGSYKDFETRFLFKVDSIPNDSIVLDSLVLLLSSEINYGDVMSPISGNIYLVNGEWEEDVNLDENWDYLMNIDNSPATTTNFSLSTEDSVNYRINLPTQIIDTWRDTTAGGKNFGLLVDYDQADHIKTLHSSEASSDSIKPRLLYIYHDATTDSVVRDTAFSTADATLIDFVGQFDSEKLFISSGYTAHSFLQFDFTLIPENAIISSVNFKFTQDTVNSFINKNQPQIFLMRNVTTEFDLLPQYDIDSTFTNDLLFRVLLTEETENQLSLGSSSRGIIGQNFIQSIINK